jgi:transposase-like protein
VRDRDAGSVIEMDGWEMGEASYEARRWPLESELPEQIEVRVRRERRRRWTPTDKLRIVEEAFAPGAVAKRVAERHEISTGLLFTWGRQLTVNASAGFVPVQLMSDSAGTSSAPSDATSRLKPKWSDRDRGAQRRSRAHWRNPHRRNLEMPNLVVEEADAVVVWRRVPTAMQFEVEVPNVAEPANAIGRVRFAVAGVPAGTLRFKGECHSTRYCFRASGTARGRALPASVRFLLLGRSR